MCGIVGTNFHINEDMMSGILGTIKHRGPDNKGWHLSDKVCLGHVRLSIIDLKTGNQPLYSQNKELVLVFNGEIYNFKELRKDLKAYGHTFKTASDSEVIIHAYEQFGFECLEKFNGEFAFCLWDKGKEQFFIARDRLGIRPLYYFYDNGKFAFASSADALIATGIVKKGLNVDSLQKYFTLRYVPGENSIYKGVKRLLPGTFLTFSNDVIKMNRYWSLDFSVNNSLSFNELQENFLYLLKDSVNLRMRSDVPVGAYLSGGVDSSSIVSLMSKISNQPVKTFTVGFNTDIDENSEAKQISNYYATDHTEIYVNKDDYGVFSKAMEYFDEPIGDAIIIPTYLLSMNAAKKVKVVLTGEGADEILGGYVHHMALHYGGIYNRLMPKCLKGLSLKLIEGFPIGLLNRIFPYPAALGESGRSKLLLFLRNLSSLNDSYINLASVFSNIEKRELFGNGILSGGNDLETGLFPKSLIKPDLLNSVINIDLNGWLPDYTLLKQDRMAMANSIESRVPFLDHRLVEFAATLPIDVKMKLFKSKKILRSSMKSHLPDMESLKKKKAFYLPTEKCFDKKFSNFIKDTLSMETIKRDGILNWKFVNNLIENEQNDLLYYKKVMVLLVFQVWLNSKRKNGNIFIL